MKKKLLGIFVCMLLIATALPAVGTINNSIQVKNPVDKPLDGGWEKTFGGSDYDFGVFVLQTNDSGYIIGAETMSYGAGGIDAWLIKTDSDGNEEWNKTYGGSEDEWPYVILQTTDGYVITGLTRSFGAGDYDAWLIKTDANGNKTWDETYGGTGYDFAMTLLNTTDNGYVMGGGTNTYGAGDFDYWMIKTNANGTEQWNKTFGTSDTELFRGMRQTDDGGYILVGFVIPAASSENVYCWLVRTDADGNKLWDKKIEGKRHSAGFEIRQTTDGGFIISGATVALGFNLGPIFVYIGGDMWLVKTDANGTKEWEKSFGRIILESSGRCIELTDEGGYIIGGFTKGFGSSIKQAISFPIFSKTWVVETDADGNKVGEKEFSRGICWWIGQTNDGGFIAIGATKPHGKGDVFLIKID
jgi:hypothetical protein